jgi:hypothetical protein
MYRNRQAGLANTIYGNDVSAGSAKEHGDDFVAKNFFLETISFHSLLKTFFH